MFKNYLKTCLLFSILLVMIVAVPSCKLGRFVIYNFADITDHKKFPKRELKAPAGPFQFKTAEKPRAPKTLTQNGEEIAFEEFLEDHKTVAFLIIRNDTIQYQNYFNKYTEESIVASFSMAKSVTSMLIGCAIEDGLINSVDDSIIDYIPELEDNGFQEVTIAHLLQMTSGLKFNESYTNPFGDAATLYYGRNLHKMMSKMELEKEPGEQFRYMSGNTQLLGWVLERVLDGKTITQYLQERIWSKVGMEYDASWSIDRKNNGIEKTYCCLNARARDFAKLGRLYLNKGNWDGEQIIPEAWVTTSTTPDTTHYGGVDYYKYQWWIPNGKGNFIAEGILGQFIYVNPKKNLIMVRLGKKYDGVSWDGLFQKLAKLY